MNVKPEINDLFGRRLTYPDTSAADRFERLVGLDDQKSRLAKVLSLLINPASLHTWAAKHHPGASELTETVLRRTPLVVLAGDVGAGKTELAETVADAVARQEKIEITLFPMSLSTRGQGRVGEMTQLISAAFDHTVSEARKRVNDDGAARGGVILLIDEADALAQSRETTQMHHEDRAGVNALIRGVDQLGNGKLPAAVIMCTNRANSLDPAIKRRAADILLFNRPTAEQRKYLLERRLRGLEFAPVDIDRLVEVTGPRDGRDYGLTYSDLVQRLLPAIVLGAYPSDPITPSRALGVAEHVLPTSPFQEKAQ